MSNPVLFLGYGTGIDGVLKVQRCPIKTTVMNATTPKSALSINRLIPQIAPRTCIMGDVYLHRASPSELSCSWPTLQPSAPSRTGLAWTTGLPSIAAHSGGARPSTRMRNSSSTATIATPHGEEARSLHEELRTDAHLGRRGGSRLQLPRVVRTSAYAVTKTSIRSAGDARAREERCTHGSIEGNGQRR